MLVKHHLAVSAILLQFVSSSCFAFTPSVIRQQHNKIMTRSPVSVVSMAEEVEQSGVQLYLPMQNQWHGGSKILAAPPGMII